jgi:AcrR family transcriptional regulator
MTDHTDRRSARTRARLHGALKSLAVTRGYDHLSVQDICDAADVGRSTFYAHYTGKDDLKRGGLDYLKAELIQAHDGRVLGWTAALFAHGRAQIDLYRALHGGPGAAVSLEGVQAMLTYLIDEDFKALGIETATRRHRVRFTTAALMAVLTGWLDTGAKEPPEVMDALFHEMLENGLKNSPF